MTLVFDEPREGPATHALIVAVDEEVLGARIPYSAAASAAVITGWLTGHYRSRDAPLASIDLLSYGMPNLPTAAVAVAIREWFDRLEKDEGSIAFFYFVGPALDYRSDLILMVPDADDAKDAGTTGLAFANLSHRMASSAAHRQLYFVDGFALPPTNIRPAELLGWSTETEPRPKARAQFYGRTPIGAPVDGPSPFSRALEETFLAAGDVIDGSALGKRFHQFFERRLAQEGIFAPDAFDAGYEGKLVFSHRGGPDPRTFPAADQLPQGQTPGKKTKTSERPNVPAMPAVEEKIDLPVEGESGEDPDAPPRREEPVARPEPSMAERIASLTPRHRRCLRLVSENKSSREMAAQLRLSRNTVDHYVSEAIRRLGVNDRQSAAKLLAEHEAASELPPAKPAERAASAPEHETHFVSDDPEVERDELDRGPLAIALGRRLHQIWCRSNGIKVPGSEEAGPDGEERAAFVLHLDAPWGGGKTSFANFLARVLNPFPAGAAAPANFLTERAGSGAVGTIFIDDPPKQKGEGGTAAQWPQEARRPWIVVPFNAWQAEHCAPPWWVFYQAIRKGCFRTVWREGMAASAPAASRPPPRPFLEERVWNSAWLWRRELWWRLRNPKVLVPLATGLVAGVIALLLLQFDIVSSSQNRAAFNIGNAAGLLFAAVTLGGWLWAAAALFTETMAPGLDAAAEQRNLGSGDPFERFRRHFARTMAAVKRPVMVIVDDLDRCRPDFVVDLVRGIQTLLRSPRVVFVILGDRDWIERAFEAHHDAMKKVNVGPEQTFGARFVEKAIQMSFILPEMPRKRQDSYVRKVLLGPGAGAAPATLAAPRPELRQDLRAEFREAEEARSDKARKAAENELVEKYAARLQKEAAMTKAPAEARAAAAAAPVSKTALAKEAKEEVAKLIAEERALRVVADEGKSLLHQLAPLARFFPANPRQIKRIVNAITMYTCVAYLQRKFEQGDRLGLELAIWVIVMTEWPDSWRLLASCPELADVLAEKDPEQALVAVAEDRLPGSRGSTLKEVKRIRADPRLLALITEESPERPRLRTESVRIFTELTPLYSRLRRLSDEKAPPEAAAAIG